MIIFLWTEIELGISLNLQIVLTMHNVSAWLGRIMQFNLYDKYIMSTIAWWLSSYRCRLAGRRFWVQICRQAAWGLSVWICHLWELRFPPADLRHPDQMNWKSKSRVVHVSWCPVISHTGDLSKVWITSSMYAGIGSRSWDPEQKKHLENGWMAII